MDEELLFSYYYEGDLQSVIAGLIIKPTPNPPEVKFQVIYDDSHQKWPGKIHRYLHHPIVGWYIPCVGLEFHPQGNVVSFDTPITCEHPNCKPK